MNNEFRWGQRRYISESKYEKLSRYRVFPADVLITIMGTCGRCAVVPADIPKTINTKHLCCISLDPEFLHTYFLYHPIAQRFLEDRAKGAIMNGLNMSIIKEFPIPEVLVSKQKRFARIKAKIRGQRSSHQSFLDGAETMFRAIQHSAFSGQLNAD